jgi:hypothetical protein
MYVFNPIGHLVTGIFYSFALIFVLFVSISRKVFFAVKSLASYPLVYSMILSLFLIPYFIYLLHFTEPMFIQKCLI